MMKNRRLLIPLLLLAIVFGLTAANAFAANAGDQFDPQIQLVKKHLEFYGGISLANIITILFLTIGPLKIIPPFAKMTAGADSKLKNRLAFRGFWISTVTIVAVALVGQGMVANYRVSVAALLTAAGLVIAIAAMRSIMTQYGKKQDSSPQPESPSLAMAISPLSFPTILPPYGIATVLLIMIVGQRLDTDVNMVLAIIVGYMVLNFICMLSAHWILKVFKPQIMNVFGIVLSVIQLGIGITWIYGGIGLQAMSILQMTGS
jgi:multiple antibiotic resistance protein